MSEITQGWTLSVVGIVVAFLFMAVFILIMVGLQKLFPYKEEAQTGEGGTPTEAISVRVQSSEPDEAVIAAIAAALAIARSREAAGVGDSLAAGRGSWWAVNRSAAQQGLHAVRK